MSESQDDLVSVKVGFAGFGTGKVRNDTSALVRPFTMLIEGGKPIGRINYLFYRSDTSFVLGTLCFTPGRRLLFFPGLVGRTPTWYSKGTIVHPVRERDRLIDHLTMEANLDSFHATTLRSDGTKKLLTSCKTKKVIDDLTYWFGLSLQSDKVLEKCPDEIEFQFASSPQDSLRRTRVVMRSREDAKFHIVELSPDSELGPGTFLHVDFLVDVRDGLLRRFRKWDLAKALLSAPTVAPTGPPALKSSVSIPPTAPVRCHPVSVPDFKGIIWVVSSVRTGELVDQAIIGSL